MQRQGRTLGRLGATAGLVGALVIGVTAPNTAVAAPDPVPVDFINGTWDGGTGYPLDTDPGGSGVSGAVADLGNGLTATVTTSAVGTAAAAGRDGADQGNLNVLDGGVVDVTNPPATLPGQCQETAPFPGATGTPEIGCHETSGFALSIESVDANNTATLDNYVRYDVEFNTPVSIPNGVTLTDLDSFVIQYVTPLGTANFPVFQDAIGFETWNGAPGTPGTGSAGTAATGADLETDTIDGVTFARTINTPQPPGDPRGGLTDSADAEHHVTFTPTGEILGFSIYYWDGLADAALQGIPEAVVNTTVGLETFDVVPTQSQVEIVKEVIDGATPWSFDVTITADSDNAEQTVTLTDVTPSTIVDVDPGENYTVTETPPDGFELESIDCVDGQADFTASIDQDAGPEISCTVTNQFVTTTTTTTQPGDTTTTEPGDTTTEPGDSTTTTAPDDTTTTEPFTPTTTPPPPTPSPTDVTLPPTGASSTTTNAALAAMALLVAGIGSLVAARRAFTR